MSNTRRGHDAERRCAIELRQKGYTVVRSAASKGPFDLVAIRHDEIILIQCKRTKGPYINVGESAPLALFRVPRDVRKEFWVWVDRKGWHRWTVKQDYVTKGPLAIESSIDPDCKYEARIVKRTIP